MSKHLTIEQLKELRAGDSIYIVDYGVTMPSHLTKGYYKICTYESELAFALRVFNGKQSTFYFATYETEWIAFKDESEAVQSQQGNILNFAKDIAALFHPDADYEGIAIKEAVFDCAMKHMRGA